jgi:hypothetical protein
MPAREQVRRVREHRQALDLLGLERQVGRDERRDRERREVGEQERVIVGGQRHDGRADVAVGAGAVVDDHRLPERVGERLRDQPRDDVRRAAGRERHDDLHGLVGECGEGGIGRRGGQQQRAERADDLQMHHSLQGRESENVGLGHRGAERRLEIVEIAALVGLHDVAAEHPAVAALEALRGCFHAALRRASSSSLTSRLIVRAGTSMLIRSPVCTRPSGPPMYDSGDTCRTHAP